MRWILYIFALIVFLLANYFSGKASGNAENLFQIWILLFALISIDTGIRLRKSPFLFFPVGYLVISGYQYYLTIQGQIGTALTSGMQLIGSVLHLILGIWFLYQFFQVSKQDKELRAFYVAAGIAAVFFGSHLVSFLADVSTLEKIHSLRLSSYLMIATGGRFLLLEQTQRNHPQYANLMPMVIIIHIFIVGGKLIGNFLT